MGVAVIDYDNDGRPDLFFVNGSHFEKSPAESGPVSMLYHNVGDGFADVTQKSGVGHTGWGQGVCVGDYDNDGWTDLYVTYYGFNQNFRFGTPTRTWCSLSSPEGNDFAS